MLLVVLLLKTQMLIHVDHRLVALDLLVHVDFEFCDCHQVPSPEVIEVHDSRILPIIIIKHSSNEVLVADSHIHEVLSMSCADATSDVQMMLIEIQPDVSTKYLSANRDCRLELIYYHSLI